MHKNLAVILAKYEIATKTNPKEAKKQVIAALKQFSANAHKLDKKAFFEAEELLAEICATPKEEAQKATKKALKVISEDFDNFKLVFNDTSIFVENLTTHQKTKIHTTYNPQKAFDLSNAIKQKISIAQKVAIGYLKPKLETIAAHERVLSTHISEVKEHERTYYAKA